MRLHIAGLAAGTFMLLITIGQTGPPREKKPIDAFMVLDNSGSMRQSDPQFLLRSAAQAFAQGLPVASRMGVVIFDEESRIALPLTGRAEPHFEEDLAESLRKLNYRGQYTDIPAGFERALYELRNHSRPSAEKLIVLVTDGVVDLRDKAQVAGRKKWLQEDLLHEATNLEIQVFGIAFTEQADLQLMQSLATATKGLYDRVGEANGLSECFSKISKIATSEPQIPSSTPHPSEPGPVVPPVGFPAPAVWISLVVALGLLTAILAARNFRKAEWPLIPEKDRASLRDLSNLEHVILIERPVIVVGREQTSDVALDNDSVSQPHASIEFRGGAFYARDMRSTNGTVLHSVQERNSRRLDPMREEPLKHGDIIRFGKVKSFVFETVAGGQTVEYDGTGVVPTSCRYHSESIPDGFCPKCRVALCAKCLESHVCSEPVAGS